MNIIPSLLDNNNNFNFQNKTIADLIKESDKQYLWSERGASKTDVVVVHYISAVEILPEHPFNLEAILSIYCKYGVSCHYMVSRDGCIFQLVPPAKKAWHCGGSIMPDPDNRIMVNDFSIGIELMATKDSGFTEAQYASLIELCVFLEKDFHCTFTYVGHDQISGIRAFDMGLRKDIKVDPGILFDWNKFYRQLNAHRYTEKLPK
jgi:N-acetyl-anhydromuramyl-L-alanine amidase AmpD